MNQLSVSQQLWQITQMVLCGWVIMLTAHQKSVMAMLGKWRHRQKIAGDFMFCMCWTVLLWLVLLRVSGGMVRYYIVLGLLGGAAVYQVLCRRHLERFCRFHARGILFIWRGFRRLVTMPWKLCSRLLYRPCIKFLRKIVPKKQEFDGAGENFIENENYFSS